MVASGQVELPHYRGVGRQSGRGFGAIAQVIWRTVVPFLCKNVVSAAKRIGVDMLVFAAPEIGEVISGRKSLKSAGKRVGKKSLKKEMGSGNKQKRIIPTQSTKQSNWPRRDIFTNNSR